MNAVGLTVRGARADDAPAIRRIATIDYHRAYADTLDVDVIPAR